MKVQELSVGDVFYICWAHTKKILDGPYRLADSFQLGPSQILYYKATRVVDGGTKYLPGRMVCVKVGSMSDESC